MINIRPALPSDWERMREIYVQGVLDGGATFETACPEYETWNRGHLPGGRLVAERGGAVAGWCALSAVSERAAYAGVAELSLYVDSAFRSQGLGRALLSALIEESERLGYWSLLAVIFSKNAASIALTRSLGFREIGYREKIARDRFGVWQDTTMLERRSKIV